MSAEQQIAAPGELARIEFVSPWRPLAASRARRWLGRVTEAWRQGMALYVRAGAQLGWPGWFG